MSRVLKLTLAYDGTAYVGWQRQSSGVSIQGLVENALARLDGQRVVLHGAGRTDAGVHALGQVASASVTTALELEALRNALNAMLPPDVRVTAVENASPTFHARYDATSKTYEYWIWEGRVQLPFARTWSWHRPRCHDAGAMHLAARALVGRHDFTVFESSGSSVKTAVRTVSHASVRVEFAHPGLAGAVEAAGAPPRVSPAPSDRFLVVRVEADGFLRHMVRAIVGTLVEVGDGRRDAASLAGLLAARDRAQAGPTAPAHGLILIRVTYPAPA